MNRKLLGAGAYSADDFQTALRVCFENEELSGVPVQKRGVGFVFQGYALFKHLSVRRNIAFGVPDTALDEARIARAVSVARLPSASPRRAGPSP